MATSATILGPVSLDPRGEYDPAAQYTYLDLVRYDGSGYLVLRPVQGVTPVDGADYMRITERGGPGNKGDRGDAAGFGGVSATVDDSSGTPSVEVFASGPDTAKEFAFSFQGLKGKQGIEGEKGDPGSSIASIERTAGTGAPGTRDTYTITLTDGSTTSFEVYNGADGTGAGDMTKAVYDPQGKAQDIFKYVDDHTPKNVVTTPGGAEIETEESLGDGPHTFEFTVEDGTVVSAAQVSYDGAASGVEAQNVQGAIDALSVSVSRVSNKNLLDNAYFRDPINQRGQTEYASGYGIDRWSSVKTIISGGYVSFQDNLIQSFEWERFKPLLGKTVTLSYINKDAKLTTATGAIPNGFTSNELQGLYLGPFVMYIFPGGSAQVFRLDISDTIIAAKLELGPVQTLAHQDASGNWVLNDPPPNRALELAKCQRYQIFGPLFGVKVWTFINNTYGFFIPTPVPLIKAPTLVGKIQYRTDGNVENVDYTQSIQGFDLNHNGIYAYLSVPENTNMIFIPQGSGFDSNL